MAIPYKKILVPLDGSRLAEIALPVAIAEAAAFSAEVTLFQVLSPLAEIIRDHGYQVSPVEQFELRESNALGYLRKVRAGLARDDVRIECVVAFGRPAESIIDYAQSQAFDLVVMATHGRSGVQRWMLGSVAEKVVRGGHTPLLLVRAFAQSEAEQPL